MKLFESQYQHYGATALRMHVFEFLQQMLDSSVFSVSIFGGFIKCSYTTL